MTRYMYDSVNPDRIPDSATMVAGYVDGEFANIAEMRKRFPNATIVEIAVSSHTDDGQVLDVEPGDATPQEAVSWVQMRRRAGADPTVYVAASQWAAVRSCFQLAHVTQPHYWIADWDRVATIPHGAVAKQFANTTGFDVSITADFWPGVDHPTKKPLPVPVPTHARYVVKSGETLWSIAQDHHMSLRHLERLNPQIKDPNVIHPGDVIAVSGNVTVHVSAKYLVKTGDTLSEIAAKYHTSVSLLMTKNKSIQDPNVIYAGSYINL